MAVSQILLYISHRRCARATCLTSNTGFTEWMLETYSFPKRHNFFFFWKPSKRQDWIQHKQHTGDLWACEGWTCLLPWPILSSVGNSLHQPTDKNQVLSFQQVWFASRPAHQSTSTYCVPFPRLRRPPRRRSGSLSLDYDCFVLPSCLWLGNVLTEVDFGYLLSVRLSTISALPLMRAKLSLFPQPCCPLVAIRCYCYTS